MSIPLILVQLACLSDGTNGVDGQNGSDGVDGSQGEQGPAGPAGEQGPAGVDANAAYRWVDSQGTEVSPNPSLIYIDSSGWVWNIDATSGELGIATTCEVLQSSGIYYSLSDCKGQELVLFSSMPRQPQCIPTASGWFARPDDLTFTEECASSVYYPTSGTCSNYAYCSSSLVSPDRLLRTDNPPPTAWVGPLHIER